MVDALRKASKISFFDLIKDVSDRAIVVARFLSILELYRLGAVGFSQDTPLGDLQVSWRDANFDDETLATLGADYDS